MDMLIGALAEACAVSRDAIRFYEREGLVKAQRGPQGYRRYGPEAVQRLKLIKQAKELGFSLGEIRSLLDVWASHTLPAPDKRRILQAKIDDVDLRMRALKQLRRDLHAALLSVREDCQTPA